MAQVDIDDVPADTIMELTVELDRAFKANHCNPTCHACSKQVQIGNEFQLLSLNGVDEMLCHVCTKEDLEAKHEKDREKQVREDVAYKLSQEKRRAQGRSGYSRQTIIGKI